MCVENAASSFRSLSGFFVALVLVVLARAGVAQPLFTEGVPEIPATAQSSQQASELPRLTDLVKALKPSVVNISMEGVSSQDSGGKEHNESGSPQASSGSGFIVNADGYIVTSNHVIDKASKITVRLLDDKNDYPAEVLGQDPKTDVALIKIDAGRKLPPVVVGDSDALEVGEWVVAIGNQFQLGQTVTAGIVSAKSRRVPTGISGPYDAFIQTDAVINPGSSGGPLFNTKGQVVGINTAIFSPGRSQFGGTGFNIGIGFSIPINMAREVIVQLKDLGKVRRGLLGVLIQKVDQDVASVLSLPSRDGALVSDVMKDTPASAAGILRRDVITSFNGAVVRDHDDLPLMVARTPVGTTVPVELIRNGGVMKLSVKISELSDKAPVETKGEEPDAVGVTVEGVSEELATSLGLTPPYGVRITSVIEDSLADKAGLLKDDVIEEFAGQRFRNSAAWREFIGKEFSGATTTEKLYLALVRRKQGSRYVVIKRPPFQKSESATEARKETAAARESLPAK
jgi:serine protease Do